MPAAEPAGQFARRPARDVGHEWDRRLLGRVEGGDVQVDEADVWRAEQRSTTRW